MDKLHGWCYKVLPLAYDDSLSYYEVLCKLVAKINEIIDAGGFTPEEIKELQDDITALQRSDTTQNATISDIGGDIANIDSDISAMQNDIAELQVDITALQRSDTTQNATISDIGGDIANIESDISAMQNDIAELQAGSSEVENEALARVPIREGVVYSGKLSEAPFTFESYPYFKITVEDDPKVQSSILQIASGQNGENVHLNWYTGADLTNFNLTLVPVPGSTSNTSIFVNSPMASDIDYLNTLVIGTPPANMTVSSSAVYADTWMFGDSYYGFDRARVFGALYSLGIYPECSVAFPGANSTHGLTWLSQMIKTHVPKVIIWSLGLNDATVSTSISNLSAAKEICDSRRIRLIPATLPPIQNRDFTEYNDLVRTYPQYVDQERAVVSEGPWNMHSVPSTPNKAINDGGSLVTKNGYSATNEMYVEDGFVIDYNLTGATGDTLVALYSSSGSLLPVSVKATSSTESAYSGSITVSGATTARFSYKEGVAGTTATVSRPGSSVTLRTYDAMASDAMYGSAPGYRLNNQGAVEQAQQNLSLTNHIFVSEGDIISYDFYGISQLPAIAAYASNGSYIAASSVVPDGVAGSATRISGSYTVPSGVGAVRFSWVNTAEASAIVPVSTPINLTDLKRTVKTAIGADGTIITGSWDYMYTTEPIPVKQGDTVTYDFQSFGSYPGIAAYDATDAYLQGNSVINTGPSGTKAPMSGTYSVPDGVSTLRFSFAYNGTDVTPNTVITPKTSGEPSGTKRWAPGLLASDGVHPTPMGAMVIALEYAKSCNGITNI